MRTAPILALSAALLLSGCAAPMAGNGIDDTQAAAENADQLGTRILDQAAAEKLLSACSGAPQHLEPIAHSLTHRELRLHPVVVNCDAPESWAAARAANGGEAGQWVGLNDLADWGLPAPLRPLLARLGASA